MLKNQLQLLIKEFTSLKQKIKTKLQTLTETQTKLETTLKETKLLEAQNQENEKVLEQLCKEFKELAKELN